MLVTNYKTINQLEKMLEIAKQNGKGIYTTLSVNAEPDKYNNNVAEWLSQSKEERENKATKTYFGNGKVIFSKAKEYPVAPRNDDKPPF